MSEFVIFKHETLADVAKRLGVSTRTVSRRKAEAKEKGTLVIREQNQPELIPEPLVEPTADVKPKYAFNMSPNEISVFRIADVEVTPLTFRKNVNSSPFTYDMIAERIQNALNLDDIDFEDVFNAYHQEFKTDTFQIDDEGFTANRHGVTLKNGVLLNDDLTLKLLDAINSGDNRFIKFLRSLAKNPDRYIQEQLTKFLDHNDIEINKDGNVVAYKRVRDNFKDFYSGQYDNSVGKTISMKRKHVNSDASITCASGLHVCSKSYLKHYYTGKGVVVKCLVRPEDFVAIPHDYEHAKARVCKYRVVKVVEEAKKR